MPVLEADIRMVGMKSRKFYESLAGAFKYSAQLYKKQLGDEVEALVEYIAKSRQHGEYIGGVWKCCEDFDKFRDRLKSNCLHVGAKVETDMTLYTLWDIPMIYCPFCGTRIGALKTKKRKSKDIQRA